MDKYLKTVYDTIISEGKFGYYKCLNMFEILNEWIESPKLVEFPKEIEIDILKHIRKFTDSFYMISYKKIIEILKKYNYDYVDDVIKEVKTNGNLIIIYVSVDECEDLIENKTLNFIKEHFNDIYDNAYKIFSNIYNNRNVDGLTVFHKGEYDPNDQFSCIYLNKDSKNLKDTLEHEIGHFIKNIAGSSEKFPKIYSGMKLNSNNIEWISNILKFASKISEIIDKNNSYLKNDLKDLFLRVFSEREEQETIKSVINAFIRRYENSSNKFFINHKLLNIRQIESLENKEKIIEIRLNWLKEFLNNLNSYEFLNKNKNLLISYFNNAHKVKNNEIEFLIKCIVYLGVKELFKKYDIDEIITDNFKKFKFRDV